MTSAPGPFPEPTPSCDGLAAHQRLPIHRCQSKKKIPEPSLAMDTLSESNLPPAVCTWEESNLGTEAIRWSITECRDLESGWQESNLRPIASEAITLTKLSYIQACINFCASSALDESSQPFGGTFWTPSRCTECHLDCENRAHIEMLPPYRCATP